MDIVAQEDGRLNADELHRHVAIPTGPRQLVDLRRATFVDPGWLVAIAAVTERAVDEGREVHFLPPDSVSCVTYLARMRLPQHLTRLGIHHGMAAVREHPQGDRLYELHRFDSEDEFDELAGRVQRTFRPHHPALATALYGAVHEVASNVLDHSGQSGGYLALQRFDRRGDIAFAVADSGVGLRRSLSKRFSISDDRKAIVRASLEHVSSHDVRGRGLGISRVIAVTGQHAGYVVLVSGTCQGVFTRGRPDPTLHDLVSPLPGTLAQARLAVAHSLS